MIYNKEDGTIRMAHGVILEAVPETVSLIEDETGAGVFLRVEAAVARQFWRAPIGTIAGLDRFTACSRRESTFWMEPCVGTAIRAIPGDTQWLLARRTDGLYVLLVPILQDPLRFCLDGGDGTLSLWADSGDPAIIETSGVGAFLAVGDDPYLLQERGAVAVSRRLKTGRLRREKPLPDFVDLFGWCTWDAFYRDVSASKVCEGLESFRTGGISPKLVILDDGWLSIRSVPPGGDRLVSFDANAKFPGGLAPLIETARREYGVKRFLVWHAIAGYWAGVDGASFPTEEVCDMARRDLPDHGRDMAPVFQWMGAVCGVIPPNRIAAFYNAFFTHLAAQGVDGVKVDNQSSIELSARGLGGRVRVSQAYRLGLETACLRHFEGRLINCMSNSNEMHLMAADSVLMRTSADFWPSRPETHGAHLYTNAMVALWFGQFVHPDWDMFQSGHEMGAFHAAGRAVSGAPVYVSDKPGAHDFGLLRKLVCADGTVLRCAGPGLASPDCLFSDPTREPVLLKIFNFNTHGAVLGVFHANYERGATIPIDGEISLADVPGLPTGRYAVLAHRSGEVRLLSPGEVWRVCLEFGQWDIFTFALVQEGRAVLGLADKLNSGGAIRDASYGSDQTTFRVRDGGSLALYADREPVVITLDGRPCPTTYSAVTGRTIAQVSAAGDVAVCWDGRVHGQETQAGRVLP